MVVTRSEMNERAKAERERRTEVKSQARRSRAVKEVARRKTAIAAQTLQCIADNLVDANGNVVSKEIELPDLKKCLIRRNTGMKYRRQITNFEGANVTIDVYNVIDAFDVRCPAVAHAVKKLLCSGLRGKGDRRQDLDESIDAIMRAIQLLDAKDSDPDA